MSLAAGMRSSSSLHTVDLSLNQLGATAGRALAAVLASADCLTLSVLRLWRNPLTDDGVVALMDALSDSTAPLRMLDLRECRVSSRGAASVAHVLNDRSVARALRVLDLRGNTLNDGAVRDSLLALVTRDVHVTLK
jgi:Ran GTPase-activating protein (RanGAP) involved in mRNA processing and transport